MRGSQVRRRGGAPQSAAEYQSKATLGWLAGARSSRTHGKRCGFNTKFQNLRLDMGPGTIEHNWCTLLRWDRAFGSVSVASPRGWRQVPGLERIGWDLADPGRNQAY